MFRDDEALTAWEHRLREAEADLEEREQQAIAEHATPQQLAVFAAERDKIALDRDTIADRYDELAVAESISALRRDVAASARDQRARTAQQDLDSAHADRFAAGEDRDRAAGDRADSTDDRRRAHDARGRAATSREHAADDRGRAVDAAGEQDREMTNLRAALESRLAIGHAVGLIMARHSMRRDDAFSVLVRLSQHHNVKLRDVADMLVTAAEAELPARGGAPK